MKNTIIATLISYILLTSDKLWAVKLDKVECVMVWIVVMWLVWSMAIWMEGKLKKHEEKNKRTSY